jgi:hypothetical protein
LIENEFQESERRSIKTLRLHQTPRRDPGLKKLVRHEKAQRLLFLAERQTG